LGTFGDGRESKNSESCTLSTEREGKIKIIRYSQGITLATVSRNFGFILCARGTRFESFIFGDRREKGGKEK
jgi:hypothetical protein